MHRHAPLVPVEACQLSAYSPERTAVSGPRPRSQKFSSPGRSLFITRHSPEHGPKGGPGTRGWNVHSTSEDREKRQQPCSATAEDSPGFALVPVERRDHRVEGSELPKTNERGRCSSRTFVILLSNLLYTGGRGELELVTYLRFRFAYARTP